MSKDNKQATLVSVVIPCYNYAAYVKEAIESVLAQTYRNIEIIVIDDGSTDNSHKVIKSLQVRHNLIYIRQSNRGVVYTRNKGVELAKGAYMIQLDADDWLDSTYVEKTLSMAEVSGAHIVYTQAKIFGRANFVTDYPDYKIEYLKHDGFMNASALVHKSIFDGRSYDMYLNDKGNEDWDLFLDACLDGHAAILLDEPLLNYRKHENLHSRADAFEGTKKEILVRHHVLSKQNCKHPEQMWYFTPYINILKKQIDDFAKLDRLETEMNLREKRIERLESKIKKVESMIPIRAYRWLRRHL